MEYKQEILKDAYAIKITVTESDKIICWAYLYILKNDRHDEPYGFIENVYIEQEYRSQGIGRKLMEKVIQAARDKNCYKLIGTSRTFKTKVHEFYEKFGFMKFGFEFRMNLIESEPKQRD